MADVLRFPQPAAGEAPATDDDVTRFLTELRALGDVAPLPPSPEVAALLAEPRPRFGRRRALHLAVRVAAAVVILVGVLGTAAANHRLPGPVQQMVSRVVNDLTPFHITPVHSPGSSAPTGTRPAVHRAPATKPTEPGEAPSRTGGEDRPGGGVVDDRTGSTTAPGVPEPSSDARESGAGPGDGTPSSGGPDSVRRSGDGVEREQPDPSTPPASPPPSGPVSGPGD